MNLRNLIYATAASVVIASPVAAGSPPFDSRAMAPADAVFQVERDFDAYTHDHGYNKGFYAYSAPGALEFDSGPTPIHEQLQAKLLKDSSEKDAPSKLRWQPFDVDVAGSKTMAWDLGTWQVEGTKQAGWFFTIWQKQANGHWLWVLDTGAGPAGAAPLQARLYTIAKTWPHAELKAVGGVRGLDERLNAALAKGAASDVYAPRLVDLRMVGGDTASPAYGKSDMPALLASRPQGLSWTFDGQGASSMGDMVYTYGHAGSPQRGYYVRVWQRETPTGAWKLIADIYQSS